MRSASNTSFPISSRHPLNMSSDTKTSLPGIDTRKSPTKGVGVNFGGLAKYWDTREWVAPQSKSVKVGTELFTKVP
jgi:hypothetical protein